MKQTARIISTYSADVMGVSSALFELGGMTIMHDPSGCNSTYTTHDEPRWFDMDSMVFISGLSEIEAIMGDDEKLIGDICEAAAEMHPEFIAIAGTPIPTMVGFDFEAVADVIEQRTGIPTFGFPTTGMNTYIHGASMALAGIAERFVDEPEDKKAPSDINPVKVNIIGLTPLDFSVVGMDKSIAEWLEDSGFEVVSKWAMGSDLDELRRAAEADVNLVVSASGLGAAEVLYERFGIPYVIGLPVGRDQKQKLADVLKNFDEIGKRLIIYKDITCDNFSDKEAPDEGTVTIIGEGITSLALATAVEFGTGRNTKVLCATECPDGVLRDKDRMTPDEDDIIPELTGASVIIADPMYQPICPDVAKFIPLPSEAFSGRLYRSDIPDLIAGWETWSSQI